MAFVSLGFLTGSPRMWRSGWCWHFICSSSFIKSSLETFSSLLWSQKPKMMTRRQVAKCTWSYLEDTETCRWTCCSVVLKEISSRYSSLRSRSLYKNSFCPRSSLCIQSARKMDRSLRFLKWSFIITSLRVPRGMLTTGRIGKCKSWSKKLFFTLEI